MFTLVIVLLTILLMVLSLLFFPKIKIKNVVLDTYYLITVIGAIILILFNKISFDQIKDVLFKSFGMNPLKIIILFLSMAFLSIYLDQIGMFRFLAIKASQKFKKSQLSLFLALFILISVLTVFTSNDIIILTFTPFICYFCKNAKINPIPYLIGEFFAANTLSMTLIIGNPTNIYIATNADITFFEYFNKMFVIGLLTCILLCGLLLIIFKKSFKKEIEMHDEVATIESKFLLILGLIHLLFCTVLMAISNYIAIEMYFISLIFALSLIIITFVYKLIKKSNTKVLNESFKHLPYSFIPFLLSMVILITSLENTEYIKIFSEALSKTNSPIVYGATSFVLGNVLNNIPMSILYSEIFSYVNPGTTSIYAVIASSNLCALVSPLGSLAGMMFISLVKKQDIEFTFIKFIKFGFIGLILICFSLGLIIL